MFDLLLQDPLLGWVLGLVVGLPVLIILLGELNERLSKQNNPLAQFVRQVRHYIVPLVAVSIILQAILNLPANDGAVRFVDTLLLIVIIYVGLTLLNNLLSIANSSESTIISDVPRLYFTLGRVVVVLLIGSQILTGVWGIDISNLVTALGVGSLVIALALQDTLSNLVSGFLLLIDRPFKVGDRLLIGEIKGAGEVRGDVIDVNWRAVRIMDRDRNLVVIPNGTLGNSIIYNYSQPSTIRRYSFLITFAYDHPPNRVKAVILDAIRSANGIVAQPTPKAFVWSFGESGIEYMIRVFSHKPAIGPVRDAVIGQIYYAAKRNELTIPYNIQTVYHHDHTNAAPEDPRPEIQNVLESISVLQGLDDFAREELADNARFSYYGAGETIIRQNEADEGFYIIWKGQAKLLAKDETDTDQEVTRLERGDFFGEMALLRDKPSPVSVVALTDLELLIISHESINLVLEEVPSFALEMGQFIEERTKMVKIALGQEEVLTNGQFKPLVD